MQDGPKVGTYMLWNRWVSYIQQVIKAGTNERKFIRIDLKGYHTLPRYSNRGWTRVVRLVSFYYGKAR